LSIRAATVRGSFLLAVGDGKDFPFGAIANLSQRFIGQLRGYGHDLNDADCVIVDLQNGILANSLFAASEFELVARSSFIEVGITFLDIEQKEPHIGAAFNGHSAIKVDDVTTGVPVTFDAFLYFPLNQRTVRYLKIGSTFKLPQKEKLLASGTDSFLIKPGEIRAFREFFVRNSLQDVVAGRTKGPKKVG
jgi:hypothetical protein